jgi:predicted O-methyltransferase YrrM
MASIPKTLKVAVDKSSRAQHDLVKSNDRLDKAMQNSDKNGLPPISINAAQGQYLSILCQLVGAKSILEIGTLGGYSTIWFANSVPGVKVTSIEFNAKHRDVALENVKDLGNVDIILGAALDVLPKLAKEDRVFDFVFIDADWDEQKEYFDWAVKLTRKGGCVYVDNAVRQLTESEEGDPRGWALIEHVSQDERVDASLIPTLNTQRTTLSELADGFLIAIVK